MMKRLIMLMLLCTTPVEALLGLSICRASSFRTLTRASLSRFPQQRSLRVTHKPANSCAGVQRQELVRAAQTISRDVKELDRKVSRVSWVVVGTQLALMLTIAGSGR